MTRTQQIALAREAIRRNRERWREVADFVIRRDRADREARARHELLWGPDATYPVRFMTRDEVIADEGADFPFGVRSADLGPVESTKFPAHELPGATTRPGPGPVGG